MVVGGIRFNDHPDQINEYASKCGVKIILVEERSKCGGELHL